VEERPGRAELIPELSKAKGEKSLRHGHENLAAVGEHSIDPFRFVCAVNDQGKISAPHGLSAGDIRSHKFRLSDVYAGMEDGVFPIGWTSIRIRPLAVGHHHGDLSAKMLFVEAECLLAGAGIVHIRV